MVGTAREDAKCPPPNHKLNIAELAQSSVTWRAVRHPHSPLLTTASASPSNDCDLKWAARCGTRAGPLGPVPN